MLRAVIREKYPTKSEEHLLRLQEEVLAGHIEKW